jgi:hypothetical protein
MFALTWKTLATVTSVACILEPLILLPAGSLSLRFSAQRAFKTNEDQSLCFAKSGYC